MTASNWDRLTRIAAPEGEALTLEAAKSHLRVVGTTHEDDDIGGMIRDAVDQVDGTEGWGLCLITQTWRLSLDGWPADGIVIPLRPVQSVDAITYVDAAGVSQTLAPAAYVYDLDRKMVTIYPAEASSWPSLATRPGVVKVTFTAGYGDEADAIPGDLIGAIKLLLGHRYENREAVNVGNIVSEYPLGVEAVQLRYGKRLG